MAIKIGNIGKYEVFPAGTALQLIAHEKRKVRLVVNCEAETRFDVVQDGNVIFLARVQGHQPIEFIVEGPCAVQPTSEGEVWLATDEGSHIVYETDEPSFVTLDFTASPQLTEFERMQAIANLKREQREQETLELLEQLRAEKAALDEAKHEQEISGDDNSGGQGAPPATSADPAGEVDPGAAGHAGTPAGASGAAKPAK